MRFIGSKDLITSEIISLLKQKNLLSKNLVFFDAFCGTGSVSNSVKEHFHLIINDLMRWSVIYTKGKLNSANCNFKKLGFDPFKFLNSTNKIKKGFFYKNYSPGGSFRKYFSKENAGRIDFFRETIEHWKKYNQINDNEYSFLLYNLIESVSLVSNTAGVYGAFLKHWDTRATKKIQFVNTKLEIDKKFKINFYNKKIEEIISKIKCDILYIDPPYTQNQYGTQYHLLETLVLNDNPPVSKITGSRPVTPLRSNWSVDYKCHILFDKLISQTKAKHIMFSYSKDGFMSRSFIEASLKRYGKPNTYICKKIKYSKYQNFKSKNNKDHFEYLFYVEKKDNNEVVYESPLNYIGSKSRVVPELKKNLPKNIDIFIDLFGGGLNVGSNISSREVLYNDINHIVKNLIESFKTIDTYKYILEIKRIIKRFDLKPSSLESYIKLRNYYNSLKIEQRKPSLLMTMILYGYNQQIRFNSNLDFNNPVGMRWFNEKVLEKMISFSRNLKERKINFISKDYLKLNGEIKKNSFIFMDPPYLLTTGSYNDGKRGFKDWNKETENELFNFADTLNKNKKKFMITYLLEHKGKKNKTLANWIKKNSYRIINVKAATAVKRKEILILNYH